MFQLLFFNVSTYFYFLCTFSCCKDQCSSYLISLLVMCLTNLVWPSPTGDGGPPSGGPHSPGGTPPWAPPPAARPPGRPPAARPLEKMCRGAFFLQPGNPPPGLEFVVGIRAKSQPPHTIFLSPVGQNLGSGGGRKWASVLLVSDTSARGKKMRNQWYRKRPWQLLC